MKIINERRLDRRVRLLQFAAMLCALFAAVGIMVGIHDANPAAGWIVPGLAGLVSGVGFAAFWHWAIGSLIIVVKPLRIALALLLSGLVTILALAGSAQGIAQSIAGHAAMVHEMENRIEGYSKALDEAFRQGTVWSQLANAALSIEAGYRALAESEQAGEHNTGKGCGPLCAKDQEFAAAFHTAGERLAALHDDANAMRVAGNGGVAALQLAAADGDQKAFLTAVTTVNRAITDLNGIDPTPIITVTGVTNVDTSSRKMEPDSSTAEFRALAKKLLDERQTVAPPTFTPISLGEATRAQMFGSAAHGWILAGAIDVLPFIFLIAAFLMSREPWNWGSNQRHEPTREDEAKAQDDHVNPKQPAAEPPPADRSQPVERPRIAAE